MNGSTNTGSAELGFLLHDVARLMRKRFEQHARGFGLTRAQWQALAYLSRNEGISQTGLADLLDVEPITLSRIVDRLVESGFVDRIPHATDRRVWRLSLTDAAKPKLKQVRELGERTRSETLAGLSQSDRECLLKSLSVMRSNLSAACDAPVTNKKKVGDG
ncbi:MarR family winged helix-turn-helix transcriptional regulator [Bradyrhizobium sp. LLZ17]|uniref:MarR family winged helix-turn-helix transcriptional regulator n=1 Tax=Bradyrhizobium sp. LLZ17 TaxID=3239388 RepID=A0AB39XSV7_9BRAD